jgi:hypothetical protein
MKVIETTVCGMAVLNVQALDFNISFSLNEVGYKLLNEVKPISYHELSQMTYFKIKTIGSAPSTFSTSLREWILSTKKIFQFFFLNFHISTINQLFSISFKFKYCSIFIILWSKCLHDSLNFFPFSSLSLLS